MNPDRWLTWKPRRPISDEEAKSEPTKPTKPGSDGFVGSVSGPTSQIAPLEEVLKGRALELYLTDGDRLFIVADEEDAATLAEPRGTVYTAAELRRIIRVNDPELVAEVRHWKQEFNAIVREFQPHRVNGKRS